MNESQPFQEWKLDAKAADEIVKRVFEPMTRQPARHPFWHVCRVCVSTAKIVLIAFVVEVVTLVPAHWLLEKLGAL